MIEVLVRVLVRALVRARAAVGIAAREGCITIAPSRAWMGAVVDGRQMLEIQVRVDLRSADVHMPEHFLHRAQIAARFEHVAGEGVAQRVWMHAPVDAACAAAAVQALLYGARRQAPSARTDEHGAGVAILARR